MTCGIYCYIDKNINQVIYVGKDSYINKNERHKQHLKLSNKNNQPINRILQNNPQRYEYKILKKGNFSKSLLNALEIIYIKRYGTYDNRKGHGKSYGFNFTIGGDGSIGYKHSIKTLQKMRKENHPFYGKNRPNKTKERISKSQTSTGFYRVVRQKDSQAKNGFKWKYHYRIGDKRKVIARVNLFDLKEKVSAENLPWKTLDKERAKQTCQKYNYNYEELEKYFGIKRNNQEEKELMSIRRSQAGTGTGFYKVSLHKNSGCLQGFTWTYNYKVSKKQKEISRVNLIELKKIILQKDLEWQVVDEEKAKRTCKKYGYNYEDLK